MYSPSRGWDMDNDNRIELEPVSSSSIHAVGYDAARLLLAVQFKNGDVFQYANITEGLAEAFVTSESLGRFYASRIKGQFSAAKLTGLCSKCGAGGYLGDACSDCGCATYSEPPRPVLHLVSYDTPKSGRLFLTVAGERVTKRELARTVEGVTCGECLAAQQSINEMSF